MALRDTDPAEIGGYRIEDRLGIGGMGVVYLARSASGRRLAVKVVHGQYADDDEFRIRFRREVAAARQVSGAFTAPVVDADADAPSPWMATLYIPGEDLGTHVRRHGPLTPDRLRELAAGLTEALRDIHRAGVVHRDLKPANVMLAEDGPRVIDFGVSRAVESTSADALTQTGRVMGTPPFMSPEQFTSPHEVGPATDVFSLGAVLVYAATRRGPFDSASHWETATRVVEGTADLDGVPDELLPFVRLCLDKHPKTRPTPDELLYVLREGRLPDRPPIERPDRAGLPTEPVRRHRRRWWPAAVALTAVLAALAVTAVTDRGDVSGADLPAGWQPWHRQAKVVSVGGPNGSFNRCAATGGSLVCAGDGVLAARFALADGRQAWGRPVTSSPGDSGTVFGFGAGGVAYVYDAAGGDPDAQDNPTTTHYTVQALRVATGEVLWKKPTRPAHLALPEDANTTVTDDGQSLTERSVTTYTDGGYALVTKRGLITVYGEKGDTYALLGAGHGEVLWQHRLPPAAVSGKDTCALQGAGGRPYLLCTTYTDKAESGRTSVTELDPDTGRPRWTVTVDGNRTLLGLTGGHLVLGPDVVAPDPPAVRSLTLISGTTHVVTTVRLSQPESGATLGLADGTAYFTRTSGSIRAVDPLTGRLRWQSDSTVEQPGPPLATADRVYIASGTGRLAALDARTGSVVATSPGRDDGGTTLSAHGTHPPLVLVGDALYVPYGLRSVYTVNVKDL
ncbi:protein kinase domain-containing protein [Streptomyces sp. NPDC001709]